MWICSIIIYSTYGYGYPHIYHHHISWLVVWNTTFIFPYIGNNNPYWLIFFRRVETTNQYLYLSPYIFFGRWKALKVPAQSLESWMASFAWPWSGRLIRIGPFIEYMFKSPTAQRIKGFILKQKKWWKSRFCFFFLLFVLNLFFFFLFWWFFLSSCFFLWFWFWLCFC